MKTKTARRWLLRQKWNIAKLNLGWYKPGGQFHKKFLECERATGNILLRKFN